MDSTPVKYNPEANEANIVIFGNARFTFLTSAMVRIEYACDGVFEDRPTLKVVNRLTQSVHFQKEIKENKITIKTDSICLQYTNDEQNFNPGNMEIQFTLNGESVVWHPGQKDPANLKGTIRTLDQMKGNMRWHNEKFKKVELEQGLLSRSGWALIDDSKEIVLDNNDNRYWVKAREEGERTDWYFMAYGHEYKQALYDAMKIFGTQPLPPRFSLGYWWSRYWAYTDKEMEKIVNDLNRMNIPLDVLVVDMDWHLDGWTGYTWDENYFPDYKDFLTWTKNNGLKVTLNLHPADGVKKHEIQFNEMAQTMGLEPENTESISFDCTDPSYMDAYFKVLHNPLESEGVDFWWLDWQQGTETKIKGLDPLPWLNYLHWQDMEKRNEMKRPLIFSRYGGLGSGRYPIGFSGDTFIAWESLTFQPYFTSTSANVLYGYWSHDIGGHFGAKPEGQMYSRWVQFGVFSPVLRTHATKDAENDRRFWMFGEPYLSVMIDAVRRRYEMVPYIYTENRKCMETGISLCRPLYYEYPEQEEAYTFKNEYFFGEKMLVAPVVKPIDETDDLAEVKLWIPEGKWFDISCGDVINGPQIVKRRYTISDVPVFVQEGTVIAGQQFCQRLESGSYKDLIFTIYPGEKGEYNLYEDDGISQKYLQGECSWLKIRHYNEKSKKIIVLEPINGSYDNLIQSRTLEIRLPSHIPPLEVKAGVVKLDWSYRLESNGWTYDGDNGAVIIKIDNYNVVKGLKIEITVDPDIKPELAYGLKGVLNRLDMALQYSHVTGNVWERKIAGMAQTGNRISRNPDKSEEEVQNLHEKLSTFPDECNKVIKELKKQKWAVKEAKKVKAIITAINKQFG